MMGGDNRDVGSHAGFEFHVWIFHGNDSVVCDNILDSEWGITDLEDFAVKCPVRKCVHGEIYILSDNNPSNIRLGDIGINLHFGQIVGNCEQRRRTEAGGDGLTNIHIAGDNSAIDRRTNGAMEQIHLCACQCRLAILQHGFSLMQIGEGGVEV